MNVKFVCLSGGMLKTVWLEYTGVCKSSSLPSTIIRKDTLHTSFNALGLLQNLTMT